MLLLWNSDRRKRSFGILCIFVSSFYFHLSRLSSNSKSPATPAQVQTNQVLPDLVRLDEHGTRSQVCDPSSFRDLSAHFNNNRKSAVREDLVLLEYFPGLCGGTYLEMGALDGVDGSNSYAFRSLNWRGVLVEGSPRNYAALEKNRLDELAVVHAAVCEKRQKVHFVEMDHTGVGGIWEFAAESFKEMWWPGLKVDDMPAVDCLPLKDLFSEYTNLGEYVYIDFFSLDVEGAELSVLKSIDFNTTSFGIIFIEADKHDQEKNRGVREHLANNGYEFLGHRVRSDWFRNNNFKYIYKEVLP